MPQIVPLQALPSQTLQCQLGGQATTLNVYQQAYGLYVDVLLSGQVVVQGIIALNGNLIIRNSYFNYSGDFIFLDTQAAPGSGTDPVYTGFGPNGRYVLLYLTAADIAALNPPAGVE